MFLIIKHLGNFKNKRIFYFHMGLFGKRKERVVDLSAGYAFSRTISRPNVQPVKNTESSDLGFLSDMASNSSTMTSDDISWDNEPSQSQEYKTVGYAQEKKQKLAKRFLDMTEKIEDLSNQIYHLTQRMELIEKKLKINFG